MFNKQKINISLLRDFPDEDTRSAVAEGSYIYREKQRMNRQLLVYGLMG